MPHALVTGCLGGYGTAICRVLKGHGFTVSGLARREGECEADEVFQIDLAKLHREPEAVRSEVERLRAFLAGRLDLLVNNAAHQVVKNFDELQVEDLDLTLSTNLVAPFILIKEFVHELESARGSVVNVASIHANLTKPGFVAYATSKGAMVTMTKALAVELGPRGIRVNAILPAATETPLLKAGFEDDPEAYESLKAYHPLGAIATTDQVAEVIAFLASPGAGFMSGSAVEIDGGIGARLHDPV